MDEAKKVGGEGFQEMDLGEIQELIDTTPEELTQDDLVEMGASEPSEKEDREEAVPKNKLTLDSLAEVVQVFSLTSFRTLSLL